MLSATMIIVQKTIVFAFPSFFSARRGEGTWCGCPDFWWKTATCFSDEIESESGEKSVFYAAKEPSSYDFWLADLRLGIFRVAKDKLSSCER